MSCRVVDTSYGLAYNGGTMSTSSLLFFIQEKDLALDARREELRQVLARLADESAITKAREDLEQASQELSRLEREQRGAEHEAEDLRAKVTALEEKMYSGRVTNSKELLSMQEEAQGLKARLRKLEDAVLDLMMQADAARSSVAQLQGTHKQTVKQREQEKAELLQRQATLEAEVSGLDAERQSLTAGVSPQALELYGRLRPVKQGRAVAKVEGGMCQGCRISLPSQHWQQARAGGALVQCTSCSRILYVS